MKPKEPDPKLHQREPGQASQVILVSHHHSLHQDKTKYQDPLNSVDQRLEIIIPVRAAQVCQIVQLVDLGKNTKNTKSNQHGSLG